MDKKTFHKKWYYQLLRVVFFGSLVFFSGSLIVIGLTEDDIPMAGFVWAGVVTLGYWLTKRFFYFVMFGEAILPRKSARVQQELDDDLFSK